MIDSKAIISAKKLVDELIDLKTSYDKLNNPNSHLSVCVMTDDGESVATPLCDSMVSDVQKLIEIRMNEKWNALRKLL